MKIYTVYRTDDIYAEHCGTFATRKGARKAAIKIVKEILKDLSWEDFYDLLEDLDKYDEIMDIVRIEEEEIGD